MQLKILRLIKEFSCIYSGICFPRRVFAQRGWQVDVPIWAWTKQTVWFHEKLTTSESTNPWVDSVHNVSKNMLLCESEGSAYSNKSCPHLLSDFLIFAVKKQNKNLLFNYWKKLCNKTAHDIPKLSTCIFLAVICFSLCETINLSKLNHASWALWHLNWLIQTSFKSVH